MLKPYVVANWAGSWIVTNKPTNSLAKNSKEVNVLHSDSLYLRRHGEKVTKDKRKFPTIELFNDEEKMGLFTRNQCPSQRSRH